MQRVPWRECVRTVPLAAWVGVAIAIVWSAFLCTVQPPGRFFTITLQANAFVALFYGVFLLGARMDMRGARMTPIYAVVSITHMAWVLFAASGFASMLNMLFPLGGRDAYTPVSLIVTTGIVYLGLIAIVNRRAWTLAPMLIGLTVSTTIVALGGGQLLDTRGFGVTVAFLHLGIAASLLLGVVEVRIRAARISAGFCPSCGYNASATHGRCPECGKHRDEIDDGLL